MRGLLAPHGPRAYCQGPWTQRGAEDGWQSLPDQKRPLSTQPGLPTVLQGWAVSRGPQAQVQSGFRAWTPNAEWDGRGKAPPCLARRREDHPYRDRPPRGCWGLRVLAPECRRPSPPSPDLRGPCPLVLSALTLGLWIARGNAGAEAGAGASSRHPAPASGGTLLWNLPCPSQCARREAPADLRSRAHSAACWCLCYFCSRPK